MVGLSKLGDERSLPEDVSNRFFASFGRLELVGTGPTVDSSMLVQAVPAQATPMTQVS